MQIWPYSKVNSGSSFVKTLLGLSSKWCIGSFKVISLLFQRRRFLNFFYHIWAWWPSWSCDLDHSYKYMFPRSRPKEATNEIWFSEKKMSEDVYWRYIYGKIAQGQVTPKWIIQSGQNLIIEDVMHVLVPTNLMTIQSQMTGLLIWQCQIWALLALKGE